MESSSSTVRSTSSKKTPTLSRLLSNVASTAAGGDTSFAAFKALPIDPAKSRPEFAPIEEPAIDELVDAKTCKEKVNIVVNAIATACNEARGTVKVGLIQEGDIVSLAEAQKATSAMMKIEYGLKRLLWLGAG